MASIISAGTTSGTSLNLSGDTSGVLQLATNGSTTAVTISTGQLVGIGTTSPDGLLTLPATASNTPKIRLQSATSDVDVTITSYADSIGTYAAFASNFYLNSTGDEAVFDSAKRSSFIRVDGRSTGAITFGTAATGVTPERMRIDSSGNVGIGTSIPNNRLHVNSGASAISTRFQTTTTVSVIDFVDTNTTAGPYLGSIGNALYFGTNSAERMRINVDGQITMPSQPAFYAKKTNGTGGVITGTITAISFNATDFNIGGHFNTSTSRFTAPVGGTYAFMWNAVSATGSWNGQMSAGNTTNTSLYKNGSRIPSTTNYATTGSSNNSIPIGGSAVVYLSAGDYVTVGIPESGGQLGDGNGANSERLGFGGYLIG